MKTFNLRVLTFCLCVCLCSFQSAGAVEVPITRICEAMIQQNVESIENEKRIFNIKSGGNTIWGFVALGFTYEAPVGIAAAGSTAVLGITGNMLIRDRVRNLKKAAQLYKDAAIGEGLLLLGVAMELEGSYSDETEAAAEDLGNRLNYLNASGEGCLDKEKGILGYNEILDLLREE